MARHIRITNQQCVTREGYVTCSAECLLVDAEGGDSQLLHRVSFRFQWEQEFSLIGGEAFITISLFPAMRLGLPVVSDAPVEPGYLENLQRMQDILVAWFPAAGLTKVDITAPPRELCDTPNREVIAFFSGGVDSFHTAWRRRDTVDRLVFIDGFDTHLHLPESRDMVRGALAEAAREMGKPLTIVETDARLFLDKHAKWELCGTTVAGAVLQLFTPWVREGLLASTHPWNGVHLLADGSLLVEQFSLRDTRMTVDSMDVGRHGKVVELGECPAAMRHLRVCWDAPGDALNCGKCEKCLRTMAALHVAGILEKCRPFPKEFDVERVKALRIKLERQVKLWEMTQQALPDGPLRELLDGLVGRTRANITAENLWAAGKDLTDGKGWPVLARKLGKPLLATAWETDPEWVLKKCRQRLPGLREELWKLVRKKRPSLLKVVLDWLAERSRTQSNGRTPHTVPSP